MRKSVMTEFTPRSTADVVEVLIRQHEQIKGLFGQVLPTVGDQRRKAFTDLRALLTIHETAEEEVVHPRARYEIEEGARIVRARRDEERAAKELLSELVRMDVDSRSFTEKFGALQAAVLAHAEVEEREEFSQLRVDMDDQQLQRMGAAVRLADKIAPTGPGVNSANPNVISGPFAAMLDRVRQEITSPDPDD